MNRGRFAIGGLALRITLLSVLVTICAVGVIGFGVLVVAQSVFNRLMVQAGTPAAEAHAMFDHGVLGIFVIATAIAIAVSGVLAVVLAARFTRPLQEMARVARRIADGDYEARMVRRQPDSGAASGGVARFLDPVEALEDMRQVLGRDAVTAVGDRYQHLGAARLGAEDHASAGRRVAAGVLDQVAQHLGQVVRIGSHPQPRRRAKVHGDAPGLERGPEQLAG